MSKMVEISLSILCIAFAFFIIMIPFMILWENKGRNEQKNKYYEIKYLFGVIEYTIYVKAKTKNDALIKLCKKEKTINKIKSIKEVEEDE